MGFVGMQAEGSRDDDTSTRPEILQPPVQHGGRTVKMVENFPHHHGVEEPGHLPCPYEVAVYDLGALAHLVRLLAKQLTGEAESVGVDVYPGDRDAAAREQHLQYPFAAPHVQHVRPTRFGGYPVDPAAEPVAGRPRIDQAKIDLGHMVPTW